MNRRIRTACIVCLSVLSVIGLFSSLVPVLSTTTVAARGPQPGTQEATTRISAERSRVRELTQTLLKLNTEYQLAGNAERSRLLDSLRDVAAERRALLAGLVEKDAREIINTALPDQLRAALPSAIQDDVEQSVNVAGDLEVLYQCGEQASRVLYFLDAGGERLSLYFAGDPPAGLLTGSRVRVKGVRIGQAIALESSPRSLRASSIDGLQTMAMALAPNTFGEQKVLVLLCNFQDLQTQPFSVSQVQSTVFGTVNDFYKESSYQQTWLAGDVYGWYTLPISSSTCDTSAIATYARQAATAAGVNLSAYNRHVFAYPSLSTCGFTGASTVGGSPSQSWINGSMTLRTVGHELEHAIGLYHARALECGADVIGSSCTVVEYGDILDILGQSGKTGHSHAHQKERLGWLGYGSSPGLTTVQSGGTYWLEPYETLGTNAKALKVLKSTDPTTGVKTWYYVEFRRPIGFDTFISSNINVMNGVMVHTGVEPYGRDNYLLDMTPETSSWTDAALDVGRSYNDPNTGVTITPLSVDNSGAAVNVSFGAQPCVRANPSMPLSPSASQWVAAGTTVSYQVSVTNNDSGGCTASGFNLQVVLPAGWTGVFSNASLTLSPGASGSTTLQVTSPSSAADGFYNVGVSASNSSDPTYLASSSATCVIVSSLGVGLSSAQASYTRSQTATVTAIVSSGGSPVSGASVTFTMTKSNGSVVTGTATTVTNGSAVFSYRFNRKKDPAGTYGLSANANLNGLSGSNTTSFVVQ